MLVYCQVFLVLVLVKLTVIILIFIQINVLYSNMEDVLGNYGQGESHDKIHTILDVPLFKMFLVVIVWREMTGRYPQSKIPLTIF